MEFDDWTQTHLSSIIKFNSYSPKLWQFNVNFQVTFNAVGIWLHNTESAHARNIKGLTWWTVPSISTGTIKSALLIGYNRKSEKSAGCLTKKIPSFYGQINNDLYVIFHQNLTFNLIEIISFLWTSCYKSDIHDRPLKYWSDDFNYTKHGGLQYGFKTEKTSQCKTCSQWGRKRPFLLSHCHTLKELWTRVSSRSITAQILLVSLLRTAGRRYFSAGL